ncbi:MAG: ATP-binding protein [Solirubrobacterales bacterium]
MPRTGDSRNPYTPDMGARPPFLAGREAELAYFAELLDQLGQGGTQKHLILTGLRGVGKTVLLNEFEGLCEDAGWKGEAREVTEESRIADVIAKSARRALVEMSSTKRAGNAVRRAMRALKAFTVTVGDVAFSLDVETLEGVADSGDLAEDMRDLLVEVGTAARESDSGFALILDEMQNLSRPDLAAVIVGLHRAKQKGLPVALVGGGLPLLPELTAEAKSYAERGFEFRSVGPLDAAASRAALEEPARERGVRWQANALDCVVEATEGYPYFLQEYGRAIWKIGSGETIASADVDAARPVARDYLDENFFSQRIGKLPLTESRYLAALASLGDGPQRTAEIAAVLGGEPQSVSVSRDRLIKASLIYAPRRGEVDFTVPLCADYVRRRMPETRSSMEILDEMREERL